ncbi:MAG TPA: Uma2 family endonuclease, partial [Pirellulales bacterium]|nr:Uma2 family endonuclease [Pirellulales bacterium]
YPTGDGRPMAETPVHRQNLTNSIEVLDLWFADDPLAYVSGNMFIYYEPGNRLKHVSPDVFVVLGVPKDKERDAYFVWLEGRGPDLVVELTSASTRGEDTGDKKRIYQDILGVREYILFDPKGEYLKPALQGFRLREGKYVEIPPVGGRLPSEVLGLQFEGHDKELRLYDPTAGRWLPTFRELQARTETERDQVTVKLDQTETKLGQTEAKLGQTDGQLRETEAKLGQTDAQLRQTEAKLGQTDAQLRQTEAKLGQTDAQLRQTAAERDRATAETERLEKELAELRRHLGRTAT